MGAQLGSSGVMSEINMTPLIDIVLVVLIIMMVNIPIQIEQMGVKLPGQVQTSIPKDVPVEQLIIAVYAEDEEGKHPVALNRKLMNQDDMFYEVTRRLRPMAKKAVFIDAHPETPYGLVVDMMDLAREAGAAKVGLGRLKEAGPLPWTSLAAGTRPKGVIIGSPTVVGPLKDVAADAAITPFKGNLEACYNLGLATDRELSGRVVLRIGIGPDGEHMSEKISSSNLENDAVETCISELLPSIAFEALGYRDNGEGLTAIVQYPLMFSPG